jgi:hypothetical protein
MKPEQADGDQQHQDDGQGHQELAPDPDGDPGHQSGQVPLGGR